MLEILYQGEDKKLTFTYTDKNDDAVDLNTVDDILVVLSINGTVVASFTKVSDVETEDLTIDDAAAGEFSAHITRVMSLTFTPGTLTAEVLTKETVSGFGDGFHSIFKEKAYQVEKSKTTDYGA